VERFTAADRVKSVRGPRWPDIVVGGSRWPDIVVGGSRWPDIVVGGSRWPDIVVGGLRWPDIVSTSTFIGATLALYVLRRLGFSGCPVRLESDCISALGWAEKRDSQERQESKQCLEGILSGFGQLGTQSPFESFGFVMGKDNFQCDSLSRDTVVADLGIVGLIDFGPYLSSTLLRTLEFCNLARIQLQTRASSSTGSEIDHL